MGVSVSDDVDPQRFRQTDRRLMHSWGVILAALRFILIFFADKRVQPL